MEHHFFSMRFIEGGTLAARMADPKSRPSSRSAAALLVKVCRAVHFAHQRGILHPVLEPFSTKARDQEFRPPQWSRSSTSIRTQEHIPMRRQSFRASAGLETRDRADPPIPNASQIR